jgi:hypothetical protein
MATTAKRFKIPLNAVSGTRCTASKATQLAGLLEQAALVIWDELPMQNKYDFEAVDALLKDIRDCDQPFGGIPMVLGGDFAQILPVVKRSNRARTVATNLQQPPLWDHFTVLRLPKTGEGGGRGRTGEEGKNGGERRKKREEGEDGGGSTLVRRKGRTLHANSNWFVCL